LFINFSQFSPAMSKSLMIVFLSTPVSLSVVRIEQPSIRCDRTDKAFSSVTLILSRTLTFGSWKVLPQNKQRNRCAPCRSLPNFFEGLSQVGQFILAAFFVTTQVYLGGYVMSSYFS